MNTAALGSEGWAALLVFETTTKQVAAYRAEPQSIGTDGRPKFDLLSVTSFKQLPALPQPESR